MPDIHLSNHISTLLAGFSIFSSLMLLVAYLFYLPDMRKSVGAKVACACLLISLALLQLTHHAYFSTGLTLLEYRAYGGLLMAIPITFYFFSRIILFMDAEYKATHVLHILPMVLVFLLPVSTLPPVAFLFGTAYTFWFVRLILKLRGQNSRFKFELFFFGMFALMALLALILGLALPKLDPHVFYTSYSLAISLAILMVVSALLFYPELLSDIIQMAELTYANSKLGSIDTDVKLQDLERLMHTEKHYQNENLSLANLAELLTLSSHQLSELINSHFGYGFPRYIREQRIREARKLLVDEPQSSILSISMEVGFKSQSNFYTAFKEISGQSPGQYRKQYS